MLYKYCKKIKELLEASIPSDRIAYYLFGDVRNIPKEVAERGFILIRPISSTTTNADTQRDLINGAIEVYVGVQTREFLQEDDYGTPHVVECLDIMEGIDSNGNMRNDTVIATLRSNINTTWLGQSGFDIEYENQREEQYIYAIKLTITVSDMRNRNNLTR